MGKKSKRSKSQKKIKSRKKKRSRKKKALIITGFLLSSFLIPSGVYVLGIVIAVQQLEIVPVSFRVKSFSWSPLGVNLKVGLQFTNPTSLDFPPIAADYVLFVEGVKIGEGSAAEFQILGDTNTIATISQFASGTGTLLAVVTTIINGFLFSGDVDIKIQITNVRILILSIPLNLEIEETLEVW